MKTNLFGGNCILFSKIYPEDGMLRGIFFVGGVLITTIEPVISNVGRQLHRTVWYSLLLYGIAVESKGKRDDYLYF